MSNSVDHSKVKVQQSRSRSRRQKISIPTINRFGLHGLAGELIRDGRDPTTLQVLEEIHFLPKKVNPLTCEDGNVVKSQESLPPIYNPDRYDEDSFGQLGLSCQTYSPLKLKRVFGRSIHPGNTVFNMTGIHKSHIIYPVSNVLVFFDYYVNSQCVLQGHHSNIVSMAKDADSKYIATADSEHDNKPPTLIIWNAKTGFPINTTPITTGDSDIQCSEIISIAFVGGLNYVGILQYVKQNEKLAEGNNGNKGEETECRGPTPRRRQMVSIWKFGHPNKEPSLEAKLELPCKTSRRFQHKILFSHDIPFHFATFSYKGYDVIFHTWVRRESQIISYVPYGHLKFMNTIGMFLAALWLQDSLLISTARGYIVEFKAQIPLGLEELPDPSNNVKEFRRYVRIEEGVPLTTIVAHKDFIVLGDAHGGLRFLDTKFRILRWTRAGSDTPICSIAFHLSDLQPPWKLAMRRTFHAAGYDHDTFHHDGISAVYDYTFGGKKYSPPLETTVRRNTLHSPEECLDVIVGYETGSVAYFHIAEDKFDMILPETLDSQKNFMDVSPATTHFVLCAEDSRIQLFNYSTFTLLQSKKLFYRSVLVTCVKYHPSGAFLVVGTGKGTLYFRHSYTLSLMSTPLRNSKSRIERIEFSSCGLFMGCYDDSSTVMLYYFHPGLQSWAFKGGSRSHYQPIVDLCFMYDEFLKYQRFFSVGKDRRVIEYDIGMSTARAGLHILTETLLDDIPTSMVFAHGFFNHEPLLHIATANNKIRMFDQNELKIRRKCQGPDYGYALNRMILITPEASMGSEAKFILTVMERQIGLMKSPIDGNPFKYMGIYAHSAPIHNVGIGGQGKDIFTLCDGAATVFMWTPNMIALENSELSGGLGITPFKRYLDANLPPGISVVEDIETIFYHLMLKRAKDQVEFLQMNLSILMDEIPTVMRTCGYFPTEHEVDQILDEAEFLQALKYGTKQEMISFEDFLILYVNHKDGGVAKEEITWAFNILGEENDDEEICIPKKKFVSLITTKGEKLLQLDLQYFLPNFYLDAVSKMSGVQISAVIEPWHLRESTHTSMYSGKSSISIPGEMDSEASFESSAHSTEDSIGAMSSKVISMVRSEESESLGKEGAAVNNKRMPRDITVNFFLQHVLPDDPHTPFQLMRDPVLDDIYDLNRVGGEHDAEKELEILLNRWKEREEWRLFKQMFEKLKDESIERRLQVAIELDYLYHTGKFPGNVLESDGTTEKETDIHESKSEVFTFPDLGFHPAPVSFPDPSVVQEKERRRSSAGILKTSRKESTVEDDSGTMRRSIRIQFRAEAEGEGDYEGEFDGEEISSPDYLFPEYKSTSWEGSIPYFDDEEEAGEIEDEDLEAHKIVEDVEDDEDDDLTFPEDEIPPVTSDTDQDVLDEVETEDETIEEADDSI